MRLLSFLLAITLSGAARAEPAFQAIVPEGMEITVENFGYSPAVRAGVVAGLPADETGAMLPATQENLIAAYERAFAQIETILNEAGASWRDVVEMTTYHTDGLHAQIDAFLEVKRRYQSEPYPAWTAIDIDRLYPDRGITEIRVTAYKPQSAE